MSEGEGSKKDFVYKLLINQAGLRHDVAWSLAANIVEGVLKASDMDKIDGNDDRQLVYLELGDQISVYGRTFVLVSVSDNMMGPAKVQFVTPLELLEKQGITREQASRAIAQVTELASHFTVSQI